MMRVYPARTDYTSDLLHGLPVILTSHRNISAFSISPLTGDGLELRQVVDYSYDLEEITPYSYSVYLDEAGVKVNYAPSHQSGIYEITFEKPGKDNYLIFHTENGEIRLAEGGLSAYQSIGNNTKVYMNVETEQKPEKSGFFSEGNLLYDKIPLRDASTVALCFNGEQKTIRLRYGISFIDEAQALRNLNREIKTYDWQQVAATGREIWNQALGKISLQGGSDDDKSVFYTALYRVYERMVNMSEDGRYFSPADRQIHHDEGSPYYTDDWIWDTYRAAHPLRTLIDPDMESDMIQSFIRMAQQSPEGWMPAFPTATGDRHGMNCNHAVAMVWDAYSKGLRGFDMEAAYKACKSAITEKSLLPWTKIPNTELDEFYREKGYYPALKDGEAEYIMEVSKSEKRQSVAVTLGTSYDYWCLAQIAKALQKDDDYRYFLKGSFNYRNLYNAETAFFHPKDRDGHFILPFDYRFSGGQGARDYYDENNGWTYRWEVQHNPADLIRLMGSPEKFAACLDQTFREPLGKGKYMFYAQLPDQTGNVGQFSMANEPSMHIPYLYNYAGQPWKTQKRIRSLIKQWFRNDLMGNPGDEDGGGMSAFVVFSSLGLYPVTPGIPVYNIGSPFFKHAKIRLGNGNVFEIEALNCSDDNKYIHSATLNGKAWNKPWISHEDIIRGGKLTLLMRNKANTEWGAAPSDAPPSAEATQ
jgi:predicted alpha-1,2-mannosidase